MINNLLQKITREAILTSIFFLPHPRRIAIERWLRGREEFRKLQLADCVIVSFGKSGRTWLRVMLSRFYQVRYGLATASLMGFDNLNARHSAIPIIFFTHDNYLRDYTGHTTSKVDFYDKKIILLVRHPADVAVSQFFQWQFRMRPSKKRLNGYPLHGEQISLADFVMQPNAGLPKIIEFMNGWAAELPHIKNILVVRYEDLRAHTEQELKRITDFIGTPGTDEQIKEAVNYASYENMKKLEEKKVFWLNGGRLLPKDRNNPDSYKVRRAKVGGYRDYFSDPEIAQIDAMIEQQLSEVFGYQKKNAN